VCGVFTVLIISLGASGEIITRVAPRTLNFAMPLSGLVVLVSAVTCIVSTICARMKRNCDAGRPVDKPVNRNRAFWFLVVFVALSGIAAVLDRQIQDVPSIQGIGRTFGPISSFVGAVISLLIIVRFRDRRFLFIAVPSAMLLALWVWRFYTQQ
jgi:hypothetical protein